ncbi:MAG: serine/threonine transporter SstT [Lachnospiraceae bacterium]|nr:serine/threonine transporter SstT [Lachnospiraceae bacterium]
MTILKTVVKVYSSASLVLRILIGLLAGVGLGLLAPGWTCPSIFGELFVNALQAIAPVLVFVLVTTSLCKDGTKLDKRFGTVIFLYLFSTLLAALVAVAVSFLFPISLKLEGDASPVSAPSGVMEVFATILRNLVMNPISAISGGNYLSILFWAVLFGLAMKTMAGSAAKDFLAQVSEGVSQIVRWIINLAPIGILGLVFSNVSSHGLAVFTDYGGLLLLLVGSMLVMALAVNSLIVYLMLRKNPFPLIFRCLKSSAVTALFTRSSAANIPVNMALCEELGLDKDMYSVSIPLGATINMDGAAITITVMTLAAAHTLGISVDLGSAFLLAFLSALAACGASGIAGGSLLLIPMACSLFGISNSAAMQVVAVGFIVGVVQDSVETALNSSSDVVFTATAELRQRIKEGRALPSFLSKNDSRNRPQ